MRRPRNIYNPRSFATVSALQPPAPSGQKASSIVICVAGGAHFLAHAPNPILAAYPMSLAALTDTA